MRYIKGKKYKESLIFLKRIDSLKPREHYTNKMLGKCYYNTEDYDKAAEHFYLATRLDGDDFKSYTYIGHISLKKGKIKSAMINYGLGTYVGNKPRDEEYIGLAEVYTEMKLPKRVIEQYKRAVDENRGNYKALFELAKKSENYYKEKRIGYDLYKEYLDRFEGKESLLDEYAKSRVIEIKRSYFKEGKILN